jgi:hypothetical protein
MKNRPVEGRSSETILPHRHEQELTEHLGCDGEQVFHDICSTLPMKCEGFGSLISEAVCVSVCEREREVVYACDLPLSLYTHRGAQLKHGLVESPLNGSNTLGFRKKMDKCKQ